MAPAQTNCNRARRRLIERCDRPWARAARLACPIVLALAGPAAAQTGDAGEQGCDAGERVIRFSHVVVAKGHPKGEAAADLAAAVNAEMNGRYCMTVFPDSTLFDDSKVLDAMLKGEVEMAAPSLSKFERYTKAFRIFDLPFLFRNEDAVEWFQHSGPGQRLRRKLAGTGLKGLAFWNAGMQQISATKPLFWPKDVAGLSFRIQNSAVLSAVMEQLDAEPKPMPFKAVKKALETGEVQGQTNTWANIFSKGFYKHQEGVTESNHGLLAYLVVTSDTFWKSLPATDQAQLNRIVAKASARANLNARQLGKDNRAALEREGVRIVRLTKEQREAWIAAMRPVWDKFAREIGADLIETAESSNL